MARTAPYKRLPPDAGTPTFDQEVHLSGFRGIKVESRVHAERQIADFLKYCESDAQQPAARMLIGAWGEGKTEAFYRYIQPQALKREHKAYLITSRSIANAYPSYEGLDTSEARLFLASIFHVLNDDGVSEIPPYSMSGVEQWIKDCLTALGCEKRKLFLFIDEVEQLLHEPKDLRRLMLGIKQLLDGAVTSLMQDGIFEGSVFIFLACTPEAYNRISTDPDMRQVFGGYGRRMDRINVEPISSIEAVQFIHGLLKYSYDGKLPDPLPISSPGVLCALATIAKMNMGHMVSLTTRLLSSSGSKDRFIEVIEPNNLKDFAIGRTITIEGHDTKCFEESLYQQILHKMDEIGAKSESYKRLLTAMLFDQKAFSTSDLVEIFGTETWKGLEAFWMGFLNNALNALGYFPGLLAFYPISGNSGQEALFNNLEVFSDQDKKGLFRFGERLFSKSDIEDLLANWTFVEHGELDYQILVPANIETVQHLFGPLPTADAERLFELCADFSGEGNVLYRLPKDLIDQIFPPPSPPGLEFIRDPSERFNLWRRATIEYSQRLKHDLPHAFVTLARYSDGNAWYFTDQKAIDLGTQIFAANLMYEREHPSKRVSILTWILVRPRVLEEDITTCIELINNSTNIPHLIIFLSNDPVSPSVLNKLSPRMYNRACFINIHPTYAKQMLASYWHINTGGAIYEDILDRSRESLLERDIGLYSRFDGWLTNGRATGFIVDNPALSEGTHKGLVNGLRLLLNSYGSGKDLKQTFDWNRDELRRLIPYGSKSGLVPETDRLESFDGFRAIVGDLQTNGFVKVNSDNHPIMQLSPCERLIIKELSIGDIHKDNWGKHLVILAVPETIIEELYVEALIQRGFVRRKKGKGKGQIKYLRTLIKSDEIHAEALSQVEGFKRRIEAHAQNFPHFPVIAHLAVAKERDIQIITLEDILGTVNNRLEAINNPQDELEIHANAAFLIRFIEESGNPLLDSAATAKQILQTVPQKLSVSYYEYLSQSIPNTLSGIQHLLNVCLDIASLEEVKDLKAIVDEANGICEKANEKSKEELRSILQELEAEEIRKHFWFDSVGSQDSPHNYYAYKARSAEELFESKRTAIDRLLSSIKSQIEGLSERKNRIYRRLISFQTDSSAKLSRQTLELLKVQSQPQPSQSQLTTISCEINSLAELGRIIRDNLSDLSSTISDLENSYEIWERLSNEESSFLSAFDYCRSQLEVAQSKFNLPEYNASLNVIDEFLAEAIRNHGKMNSQDVSSQALDSLRKELSLLREHIETIDKLIESELWKPFIEKRSNLITRIRKRLDACLALRSLPFTLSSRYEKAERVFTQESTLQEFLQGQNSCYEEIIELDEINAQAKEILNEYLDSDERAVLAGILDMYTESKSEEGIELDKLKAKVSAHDGVLNVVKSLWEKGVLSVKVSL